MKKNGFKIFTNVYRNDCGYECLDGIYNLLEWIKSHHILLKMSRDWLIWSYLYYICIITCRSWLSIETKLSSNVPLTRYNCLSIIKFKTIDNTNTRIIDCIACSVTPEGCVGTWIIYTQSYWYRNNNWKRC
jgi:hypothetical protein